MLQTNSQKLAGGDDNTPDTDENIRAQTVSRCLHTHVTPSLTEGFHENNSQNTTVYAFCNTQYCRLAFAP